MAKKFKYVSLTKREGSQWVNPINFYTTAQNYGSCSWWAAKLTGFDTSRRRYSWRSRSATVRKTYRREFLDKQTIDNSYWLDFGKLVVGDLLETEQDQYAVPKHREYFKVSAVTSSEIVLEVMSKRGMTVALKKLHGPKPIVKVVIRKGDAARFYKQVAVSSDFTGRFGAMAQVLVWLSAALKQTISQGKHKPDIEKKLGKIKKLRQRAGHDATPDNEKEACLSVAIRLMEGCVAAEYLPKANITFALANTLPKEATIASPPPRTTTTTTGSPIPPVQGAYTHNPDVLPIGEAILLALGLDASYMRVSKVRVTIKHPSYDKALFIMFSKAVSVQFMSPLLDQVGATEQDRLGTPYVNLYKPINQNLIDEAVDWAKKVEALI